MKAYSLSCKFIYFLEEFTVFYLTECLEIYGNDYLKADPENDYLKADPESGMIDP